VRMKWKYSYKLHQLYQEEFQPGPAGALEASIVSAVYTVHVNTINVDHSMNPRMAEHLW